MGSIDVLIAGDDPVIASIHRSLVESVDGFSVIALAKTSYETFDLIDSKKPNLVIIDDNLKDFSSIEVISYIRNNGVPIDIIMISAINDGLSINQALRYGVVDYILKPFNVDRFKAALATYRDFFITYQ